MNTASQDLPHHLGVLRERMLHPTDYELAVHYFLEEFAGDEKFIGQSELDDARHLLAVLANVASRALGLTPVAFEESKLMLLRAHRFHHGHATVAGRVVLFFYFAEADTGIAALIPGAQGGMEIARFRLTGGLTDPRNN